MLFQVTFLESKRVSFWPATVRLCQEAICRACHELIATWPAFNEGIGVVAVVGFIDVWNDLLEFGGLAMIMMNGLV